MANARRFGVGLGAVCADVVESLNTILKRAFNDHSGRGGGVLGATELEREGEVVSQVWEWWFLNLTSRYATTGPPIPPHAPWPNSWPPVAPRPPPLLPLRQLCFPLAMDVSAMQKMLADMFKANNRALVCFACARLLVCSD